MRNVEPAPGWMMAGKRSSAQVYGPLAVVMAAVGIEGIKLAILRDYNTVGHGAKTWPFDTIPAALEFLASGRTTPGHRGRSP